MDTETMIRNLERVEQEHKHDKVFTGQLNISLMCGDIIRKLKQLKPYEDLGITPDQIRQVGREYERVCRELGETQKELADIKRQIPPCAIGDEVWAIRNYKGYTSIHCGYVDEITYIGQPMRAVIIVKGVCRGLWGKKVFPTEEMAREYLEKQYGTNA